MFFARALAVLALALIHLSPCHAFTPAPTPSAPPSPDALAQLQIRSFLTPLIIRNDLHLFFTHLDATNITLETHYTLLYLESSFRRFPMLQHHLARLEDLEFAKLGPVYKLAVQASRNDIVGVVWEKSVGRGGDGLHVDCMAGRLWACSRAFIDHYSRAGHMLDLGVIVLNACYYNMPMDYFAEVMGLATLYIDAATLGEALVFTSARSMWDRFGMLWTYLRANTVVLSEKNLDLILKRVYLRGDNASFSMLLQIDGFTLSMINSTLATLPNARVMYQRDPTFRRVDFKWRDTMLSLYTHPHRNAM